MTQSNSVCSEEKCALYVNEHNKLINNKKCLKKSTEIKEKYCKLKIVIVL